jgi:cell division protein ZapA
MSETFAHVNIRILEKEYQVACPIDERSSLLDSAELLNEKMREIRDSGKVVGLDRIAVMAALNIANDYLKSSDFSKNVSEDVSFRIKHMREVVETAIQEGKQLEL